MANNFGRISGQLLKENLTRNGTDLAFDDLGTTEPVLKLNVTNRYISINSDTTLRDLFVNEKIRTTNLISVDRLNDPLDASSLKLSISGTTIVSRDNLNLSAATQVNANIIDTDNIRIDNRVVSTKTLNTTLDLSPAGSLDIYNQLNVTGNLRAWDDGPGTGNITLDGNITFGSTDQSGANADTISFNADINTDIIPNLNGTYSLGSLSKKWEGLYTELINGEQVISSGITSSGIDLALLQGKIWYVATNGSDILNPELTQGKHQNAPFASIGQALSQAVAGDTVYIYPGTYTETFPLTVPVGVTVKGTGIRSVTVQPTVLTESNNAFLLNGESTVSDLSVVDFYAPGYAFSFAPGFTVSTRSPYVQNITVITKGSVTSPTDPRGFDESDAGGGARVDGSLATSASKEASMLFHSVTFITPGVDALVMTNGVRVEWLNSFSYFANRGIYATNGTLGLASLGIRFGAELRSIGSANVYGNYGAEANGASTLMYLIQHNFAYIGAGKDVTNDPSLNIAANETVELAAGKIYYQSLDNKGNFKVGDAFGVSFDTGLVTINGVSVSAGGVTSINFALGTDETVIDAEQVTTGNITFSNNLLTTLSGAVNLHSGTDEIKLNANTNVTDNLDITGNLNTDGTLTIGNAYIDIVRFEAPVEFALRPKTDDDFTLGGPINKRWDKVYLDTSYIGSYKLENATISTVPTDVDIELRADGTGRIFVNQDNVEFDQDLAVNGTTNLGDNVATLAATVTGTIDHTGLLDRTGDTGQTGTYNQTGYLDVSSNVQIANVTFIDDTISTVTLDSNLELGAASTGKVTIPSADVQIDNNLFVTSDISAGSVGVTTDIVTDSYTTGDIEISLDLITTTLTDSDLEFRAAGTGKVYASQDSVKFDQDLTVDGITALKTTVIGTGTAITQVSQNLSGTSTPTGFFFYGWQILNPGQTVPTFSVIQPGWTVVGQPTWVVSVVGDGVSNYDITITGGSFASGGTYSFTGSLPSNITHVGDYLQTGSTLQTGNRNISSTLDVDSNVYFDSMSFVSNTITTTDADTDLQLKAASTGIVDINDNITIDQDLRVNSTTYTNGVTNSGITTSDTFSDSDIEITLNNIKTTVGSNDLRLLAAGTGIISVPNDAVEFNQNLTVAGTTNLKNTVIGSTTPAASLIFSGSNYLSLSDAQTIGTQAFTFECFFYSTGNFSSSIQTILGANAPLGMSIFFLTNSIIQVDRAMQDAILFTVPTMSTNTWYHLAVTRDSSGQTALFLNGVKSVNSYVTATNYSGTTGYIGWVYNTAYNFIGQLTQLKLTVGSNYYDPTAASISVPTTALTVSANTKLLLIVANSSAYITDTSGTQTVSNIGGVTYSATGPSTSNIIHVGDYYQTGNTVQTGNRTITGTLDVTNNVYFDNINIVDNRIFTTNLNDNLELRAVGSGVVVFNDNTQFSQAALFGTLETNGLTNSGTITSDIFSDGDIEINDNYITTTTGDNDLRLVPNGAGKVSLPLDPLLITQDLTVEDDALLATTTINGDLDHLGNTVQTGNVVQTGNFDLSTDLTVTGTDAFFTDVRIINNRIATSIGSNNLELRADGTAIIKIADNATFGQTLTVNGIVTTSTISAVTRTITSDIFSDSDIEINDNYITTTVGNNNLILAGSTTGGPKLEQIKFNSNTISTETTNQGFTLTIPSGNLTINAATALKVPVGTTVDRPTLAQGEFRFNSTDNLFRGYSTSTVSFAGVYSADKRTSVLAHPTNNTLLLTTNTVNNMSVSSTGLTVNSFRVDNNTTFATNIISTAITNNDLYLTPNGTGKLVIDDISLRNNEIINSANTALVLQNTGSGYVRFGGTGGLALPAGPTVVDTTGIELGDLRYNTDLSIPEIFNGVDYVGFVSENAALLSAAEVQEITNLWALVIG
jgi:hypothetical protein